MIVAKGVKVCKIRMFKGLFALITSKKQFQEFIEDNNLSVKEENYICYKGCCFCVQTDLGPVWVVCLNTNEISTLVHEVVHLAHSIMNQKGIPINYENTEIEAYLIERLYEEAAKALKINKTYRKKQKK